MISVLLLFAFFLELVNADCLRPRWIIKPTIPIPTIVDGRPNALYVLSLFT